MIHSPPNLTIFLQQVGNKNRVYVDYQNITKVINVGGRILIDDGLIACSVQSIEGNEIKTIIENTGVLGERKGCNLPNVKVDLPALTQKDNVCFFFFV